MAWRCSADSNDGLVENMWNGKLIKSTAVKAAFLKVDRGHYAPHEPYTDAPMSIGCKATISAPHMHASAVECLLPFLLPGERPRRVLDVGSGSGYLTHVMAELVGEKGVVVGLEHIAELQQLGEKNMRKSAEGRELLDSGRVRFRLCDGRKGWKEPDEKEEDKGWDAIHVGASAAELHEELLDQLRAPGRMFIPVDDTPGAKLQHIWIVDKDGEENVKKTKSMGVSYVLLMDAAAQMEGSGVKR